MTGITAGRYRGFYSVSLRKNLFLKEKKDRRLARLVPVVIPYMFADSARNAINAFPMNDGDAAIEGLEREIVESISLSVEISRMEKPYELHNISPAI